MADNINKIYCVYVDPKYALDQVVKAKNKKEAKEKAYDKIKKSMFNFNVEEGYD